MCQILTPPSMCFHTPNSQLQLGLVFHRLVTMTEDIRKQPKRGGICFASESQRAPYMAGSACGEADRTSREWGSMIEQDAHGPWQPGSKEKARQEEVKANPSNTVLITGW